MRAIEPSAFIGSHRHTEAFIGFTWPVSALQVCPTMSRRSHHEGPTRHIVSSQTWDSAPILGGSRTWINLWEVGPGSVPGTWDLVAIGAP